MANLLRALKIDKDQFLHNIVFGIYSILAKKPSY